MIYAITGNRRMDSATDRVARLTGGRSNIQHPMPTKSAIAKSETQRRVPLAHYDRELAAQGIDQRHANPLQLHRRGLVRAERIVEVVVDEIEILRRANRACDGVSAPVVADAERVSIRGDADGCRVAELVFGEG